jgi:hypothetical protein
MRITSGRVRAVHCGCDDDVHVHPVAVQPKHSRKVAPIHLAVVVADAAEVLNLKEQ